MTSKKGCPFAVFTVVFLDFRDIFSTRGFALYYIINDKSQIMKDCVGYYGNHLRHSFSVKYGRSIECLFFYDTALVMAFDTRKEKISEWQLHSFPITEKNSFNNSMYIYSGESLPSSSLLPTCFTIVRQKGKPFKMEAVTCKEINFP